MGIYNPLSFGERDAQTVLVRFVPWRCVVPFLLGLCRYAVPGARSLGRVAGQFPRRDRHLHHGEEHGLSRQGVQRQAASAGGHPQGTVSGELFYDLHTAVSMLAVPNAANALWSAYGVDTVAYLGTGYSVPVTSAGVEHYWQAMQREYFVPNLCAQPVDPAICPTGDPDVWTWQLSVAGITAALDKPITAIFTGNTKALTKRVRGRRAPTACRTPSFRFGLLKPAWYKGTFGRPDAKLVFFADYTQVRTKTLREAMTATGAATLIANPDPGQVLFIWIYAPGPDTKAQAASWHAVFETLSATP